MLLGPPGSRHITSALHGADPGEDHWASAPTLASLWRCCRLGKADVSRWGLVPHVGQSRGAPLTSVQAGVGPVCKATGHQGPGVRLGLPHAVAVIVCSRSATCWSCRVLTLLPPGARESQASDSQIVMCESYPSCKEPGQLSLGRPSSLDRKRRQ